MATSGAGRARATRCARTSRPFGAWRIVPRHLRPVETRDLSVQVLGSALPAPVALAPIGVQTLVHPDGELASARGAAAVGVPYIASTAATHPMEAIAQAGGTRWYQLYWPKDDAICESLVRRAEEAGYTAIVVTLDTFFLGWRPVDLAQGFLPFLRAEGVGQFFSDPVFRSQLEHPPEEDVQAGVGHWVSVVNRVVHVGRPRVAARDHGPADRPQGRPAPRRCPPARVTPAWTAWSSPITAGGRSTGPWPPWTRCPRWPRRSPAS